MANYELDDEALKPIRRTDKLTNSAIRVSLSMGIWAPSPGYTESIFILEAVNVAPRTVVKQLHISVEINQRKYSVMDLSQLSLAYSDQLPKVLLTGDACISRQRQAEIAGALIKHGTSETCQVPLRAFCSDTLGEEYYSDAIVISPREMMSE